WDNLQSKPDSPNPSGHTMLDGTVEITDLDRTEENRAFVRSFVEEILIGNQVERLDEFVSAERFTEHNSRLEDGLDALREELSNNPTDRKYEKIHRLLAEGSFALCVSEGYRGDVHTSFYDLFRVAEGMIVEHWDTVEAVPPRSEWVNDNGKF
ncbi:MAG: hypothetical protein AAF585_23550, partial [Verrucomicrobiota bacterium]